MKNDNGQRLDQLIKPNLSLFILRFIGVCLTFELLSFVVLGMAFPLIVQGVLFGLLYLAFLWEPAQVLLSRITGTDSPFPVLTKVTRGRGYFLWLVFRTLVWMAMTLMLIYGGLLILFQNGFLGQNLIYIFMR